MKKHMPLTIDKTVLITVAGENDTSEQLLVKSLPDALKIEVEILDIIRQNVADAYHAYNQAELCMMAQQSRIQQVYQKIMHEQKLQAADQENKET